MIQTSGYVSVSLSCFELRYVPLQSIWSITDDELSQLSGPNKSSSSGSITSHICNWQIIALGEENTLLIIYIYNVLLCIRDPRTFIEGQIKVIEFSVGCFFINKACYDYNLSESNIGRNMTSRFTWRPLNLNDL